ncbi:MAG: hypothetical protein KJ970_18310 [Candidatus Eisenbacteria bacterium]|uniref:Tol-Pal system beta propeller repeat protein TolB n=1 Tax=Eiseniibacteriota bacterium TaxID=2212470 RepID=A0A948S111_UNCEI|nr:hypothetical protein [Candidatus Eisenbacteria bacterium]MBU1950307.1 hypothetical protein [Candidatus Eisenbacteria bacterium]MBU2692877.1 hypothetical protein [Candidatus Eisenbacteria bacterium]
MIKRRVTHRKELGLIFSIAMGISFLAGSAAGQSEIQMEIRSGESFRIPILLEPIQGDESSISPEMMQDLEHTLINDLLFTDLFRVLIGTRETSWSDPNAADEEEGLPPQPQAIVSTFLEIKEGNLILNGKLEDYATAREIFASRYRVEKKMERWAAHNLSDDITRYLTGEPGVGQTRIAFVGKRGEDSDLMLIDWDGQRISPVTELSSIIVSSTWSPDGRKIAFTTYHTGAPSLAGVDLEDSSLFFISQESGLNSSPAWSPRGDRIAFTLSRDGNAEIYTARPNGSDKRRVTHSPKIDTAPVWSPSGRQLAFTSDRSGRPQIYTMDGDGANLQRITFWGSWNDSPDWAPNGDRIVFAGYIDGSFDLFIIRPDGSGLRRLTQHPGDCENPRWAPDSRHVVYSRREGQDRRLWILDVESLRERSLTPSGLTAYNPAWSPLMKATSRGARWNP